MPWTEAEIDKLVTNVQRDFTLGIVKSEFWLKLQDHGVPRHLAEKAISKKSYIIEYDHHGPTIGFLDPKSKVFCAWKSDYPTQVKTCFVASRGLDYLKRQYEVRIIWIPR